MVAATKNAYAGFDVIRFGRRFWPARGVVIAGRGTTTSAQFSSGRSTGTRLDARRRQVRDCSGRMTRRCRNSATGARVYAPRANFRLQQHSSELRRLPNSGLRVKGASVIRYSCRCAKLTLLAAVFAWTSLHVPSRALAATPYESQIGGFVTSVLTVLATGEFVGATPSNADASLNRPICKPGDYDELRAAGNNRSARDAFHRRCRLVKGENDASHVRNVVFLPAGHCEALKEAFEVALATHVYAVPGSTAGWFVIEYKGSRYTASSGIRELGRGAQFTAACREDGSLRVSTPRKRRPRQRHSLMNAQAAGGAP